MLKQKYIKNILSQRDFKRSVALVWINPEVCCNNESNGLSIHTWKRIKSNSGNSILSVAYSPSSEKNLRSSPITDSTLSIGCPLYVRLDTSKHHFPEVPKMNS